MKYLMIHSEADPEVADELESQDLWPNDDLVAFSKKGDTWWKHFRDVNDDPKKEKVGAGEFLKIGEHPSQATVTTTRECDWDSEELYSWQEKHDDFARHYEDDEEDELISYEE